MVENPSEWKSGMHDHHELEGRLQLYAVKRELTILPELLGGGTDGTVWETTSRTAVKILRKQTVFETELECYRRFLRASVRKLAGFAVPRLIDYDHELLAIEIEIVQPPRILDFGKVSLDTRGDFSEATMADWYAVHEELWGKYWPQVKRLLAALEGHGIYYSDPNPYNIVPEDYEPE